MPRFTVLRDDETARSFELDQDEMLIGRQPEAAIQLIDSTVSRSHAVIRRQGSDYVIEDLGSVNGFTIFAQRLQRHVLEPGDRVQVGHFTLIFEPPADIYALGFQDGDGASSEAPDLGMTYLSADGFGLPAATPDAPTTEQPRVPDPAAKPDAK